MRIKYPNMLPYQTCATQTDEPDVVAQFRHRLGAGRVRGRPSSAARP